MKVNTKLYLKVAARFTMGLVWIGMFYFTFLGLLLGLLPVSWLFMAPVMIALGFWNVFKLAQLWDSN